MHHEGHSGYLAINIANNNLQGWLSSAKPDLVMFMLGTNDIAQQSKSTSEITAAYTKMVGLMRASNPNMKIIVGLLLSACKKDMLISWQIDTVIALPMAQAKVTDLNNAIPAWARSLNTTASPIWIADCSTGYTSGMLRDGVHPNAQGDALIASRLSPVLINAINGQATPTPTTLSTATVPASSTVASNPTSAPVGGELPRWSQCGGSGWSGSGTCVTGTTCTAQNQYYSQCI